MCPDKYLEKWKLGLGIGDTGGNKTDKNPFPFGAFILVQGEEIINNID